ncbi:MAG: hypothetical protein GY884_32445, partial [Proteobacteria bacterium]|nr:hypothetical protein [Pseudomonadota bacterium]
MAALALAGCGGGSLGSDALADGQSAEGLEAVEDLSETSDADDASDAEEDSSTKPDVSTGPGACDQLMSFPSIPPSKPEDAVMVAPSAVAVYDEKLWVTDPAGGRVLEFTTSGTYAQHWNKFDGMDAGAAFHPHGIAVDASNMYVTDAEAGLVYKTTRSGVLSLTWGQGGAGPDLVAPRGVALVDDELFVTDTGRIHVYSTSGTLLRSFGDSGDAGMILDEPSAVAVTADP